MWQTQVIALAAKYLAPSLQNLSWNNYQTCVDLVKEIEQIRASYGLPRRWSEGEGILKEVKHWFDRNRTSWWPPDKEMAKRKFKSAVSKLQSAAQKEITNLKQQAKPTSAISATLTSITSGTKNWLWIAIGIGVVIALILILKR
ncbi:hypothetical protein J7M02_02655 [Candidatus Aerophobetes bacterium]|nr:hypothetical protein [Candidatus Aerophobetes bacterium]